ncbi:transglycosylase SLT domain-containing protein [Nocardia nova]|uniref:transglycosylase SLT domain-containing protein n=1 Tax=Nocardia nova TaxID=37330 RepID=UPI0027383A30|nr:transglycosylase SLT domain-containing protein [Nocardia nova]
MQIRRLLPLAVLAAVVTVPVAAHADAPAVPPQLQQLVQGLPQTQQDQAQQFLQTLPQPLQQVVPQTYSDNLDGWIKHALFVMGQHGIPGSYDGIYRNAMRESGGNPRAINLYDSNAAAGIPSKGLMQVIDPTFVAYHVDGTSGDIYDPVANIAAACNYAAHRYGSIDHVFSAY